MKLLTLSQFIDRVRLRIKDISQKSEDAGECIEVEGALSLVSIFKWDDFLKQPLTLGMFIPCKDGKPLEKPNRTDFRYWDYQNDTDKLEEAYQESEKLVIFKGFSHSGFHSEQNTYILSNSNIDLMMYKNKGVLYVKEWNLSGIENPVLLTISELAEATQNNPIELK